MKKIRPSTSRAKRMAQARLGLGCFRLVAMLCRVTERGKNVFFCKVRKILQNFIRRHTRGKILQDIVDRDAHATDAWLATALAGFDSYDVLVTHLVMSAGSLVKLGRSCS